MRGKAPGGGAGPIRTGGWFGERAVFGEEADNGGAGVPATGGCGGVSGNGGVTMVGAGIGAGGCEVSGLSRAGPGGQLTTVSRPCCDH